MNDNKQWSKPDYAAWRAGLREVSQLPSPQFYFTVTVVALVAIAIALIRYGGHWSAGVIIAVLIVVLGFTVFVMQWKRDGNDHSKQVGEAEPSDQPSRTEAFGETQEAV